jgi:hypothetical protein
MRWIFLGIVILFSLINVRLPSTTGGFFSNSFGSLLKSKASHVSLIRGGKHSHSRHRSYQGLRLGAFAQIGHRSVYRLATYREHNGSWGIPSSNRNAIIPKNAGERLRNRERFPDMFAGNKIVPLMEPWLEARYSHRALSENSGFRKVENGWQWHWNHIVWPFTWSLRKMVRLPWVHFPSLVVGIGLVVFGARRHQQSVWKWLLAFATIVLSIGGMWWWPWMNKHIRNVYPEILPLLSVSAIAFALVIRNQQASRLHTRLPLLQMTWYCLWPMITGLVLTRKLFAVAEEVVREPDFPPDDTVRIFVACQFEALHLLVFASLITLILFTFWLVDESIVVKHPKAGSVAVIYGYSLVLIGGAAASAWRQVTIFRVFMISTIDSEQMHEALREMVEHKQLIGRATLAAVVALTVGLMVSFRHSARIRKSVVGLATASVGLLVTGTIIATWVYELRSFMDQPFRVAENSALMRMNSLPDVNPYKFDIEYNSDFVAGKSSWRSWDGPLLMVTKAGELLGSPASQRQPEPMDGALFKEMGTTVGVTSATQEPLLVVDRSVRLGSLFHALSPWVAKQPSSFRWLLGERQHVVPEIADYGNIILERKRWQLSLEIFPTVKKVAPSRYSQPEVLGVWLHETKAYYFRMKGERGNYNWLETTSPRSYVSLGREPRISFPSWIANTVPKEVVIWTNDELRQSTVVEFLQNLFLKLAQTRPRTRFTENTRPWPKVVLTPDTKTLFSVWQADE